MSVLRWESRSGVGVEGRVSHVYRSDGGGSETHSTVREAVHLAGIGQGSHRPQSLFDALLFQQLLSARVCVFSVHAGFKLIMTIRTLVYFPFSICSNIYLFRVKKEKKQCFHLVGSGNQCIFFLKIGPANL